MRTRIDEKHIRPNQSVAGDSVAAVVPSPAHLARSTYTKQLLLYAVLHRASTRDNSTHQSSSHCVTERIDLTLAGRIDPRNRIQVTVSSTATTRSIFVHNGFDSPMPECPRDQRTVEIICYVPNVTTTLLPEYSHRSVTMLACSPSGFR